MTHRWIIASAMALLASAGALARTLDDLYEGRTIVTGRGEANRLNGLPSCLEEVLVKVSGDPRLIGDPRLAPIEADAPQLVASFRYHDRMEGMPTRDEQGSRDRPYDLLVTFDRAKIDAVLRALGSAPWTAERPRLAVFVAMHQAAAHYVLSSDGARGFGERQSLAAAAVKRGLPIVLPATAALAANGVADDVPELSAVAGLGPAAKNLGGDAALAGRLTWVEPELGWAAEWSLVDHDVPHRWQIRGVSFDEAFRNAIGGAAQILSGHGEPP